jgi:hypothetical protein
MLQELTTATCVDPRPNYPIIVLEATREISAIKCSALIVPTEDLAKKSWKNMKY